MRESPKSQTETWCKLLEISAIPPHQLVTPPSEDEDDAPPYEYDDDDIVFE